MLIQVGSYEMLLSDSVDVAAKARGQGVKVRLSIYDGMFHIFPDGKRCRRNPEKRGSRSVNLSRFCSWE